MKIPPDVELTAI